MTEETNPILGESGMEEANPILDTEEASPILGTEEENPILDETSE